MASWWGDLPDPFGAVACRLGVSGMGASVESLGDLTASSRHLRDEPSPHPAQHSKIQLFLSWAGMLKAGLGQRPLHEPLTNRAEGPALPSPDTACKILHPGWRPG